MILSVFDERSKPAFAFIFFSKGGRLVGKYIAKRILSGVITIVILITACFFLMHAIPGSPFAKGEQGVPEAVMQRLNEKYGLDQPLYMNSISPTSTRFSTATSAFPIRIPACRSTT